jgi:mannose-6-phosphate isomerase-like protein (cupin superfamily)
VDGESALLKPQQILRIAPETIHSIRTESEALLLSISIPPLDASDQRVATEHQ